MLNIPFPPTQQHTVALKRLRRSQASSGQPCAEQADVVCCCRRPGHGVRAADARRALMQGRALLLQPGRGAASRRMCAGTGSPASFQLVGGSGAFSVFVLLEMRPK